MSRQNRLSVSALLITLALAGCTDESPERRIAAAKEYLQKNDTKSAVIEIKNALQKNPDSGEARYLLGSTLLKDGNPVAAEVELRKALAAKHPDAEAVPDLARAMLMLGQGKKVVDEFGQVRLTPASAQARLQTALAGAYGSLGKTDQAQAALAAALAADPNYADALLITARQMAAARDIDGAMALVDGVIAREPANTAAWSLKANILVYAKNLPDDGLAAYRKVLGIEPKSLAAHAAIFTVLMQQGKLDEAAKQLGELKKFAAKHPQTLFFEAQLAYQKKDFKAARDLTQGLLQQAPNNPRLLQLAGAAELQLGGVAQAQTYLSKALQISPELPLARRLLIVAYLRSGQPARALTELNNASAKDGVPPALYSLAGEVHLQNGDPKTAEAYFAKALKLDPDDARKRTALAITHLAGGKGEVAIDELQNIAGADTGNTADLALISVYLRARDYAKALAAIDKLEAKQPDKPLAANLRGRVLLAQKDAAGARKSFERALSIDPGYFAAAASLAALDMADKKPEDAKKRFEALLAKNPKNGQALLALAQLAASQGAAKEEIASLLGKAIDASPTDVAPRLLLIDHQVRNKDLKQALATAQAAVTTVPNSAELLMALGRVQQLSGDMNQAIATYSKLVALQPLSPVPYVRLAEAHVVNKDKKAAAQSLRKALEVKPDFLDAQRGLILLAIDDKRYAEAIKIASVVQEQMPKQGLGLMLEGDINVARKDWPAAAAAYKAALQHADVPELAIKRHAATVESGKAAEAEQFATAWMSTHPKEISFRLYMAGTATARKDYASAEKLYQAVLQLQPESAIALNNLAWATHQLGKPGALAWAEKANTLSPNQPAFMDTLATVLSAQGEHARAMDLQGKAVLLQPKNDALRLNLARVYIAAGDKSKARAEVETVVKAGEKSPQHAEAAALLKTL